jgi:hypothetical protein
MAVNKVIYGGKVLIDLTSDDVTAETLLKGTIAHNKAGEKIVGTYEADLEIESILENGFSSGKITRTVTNDVITSTNTTTGQVLTKTIADHKVTVTLSKAGTEIGKLVRTYNDDYSVITSVNIYDGTTSTKTFDYVNKTMTLIVKNGSGSIIREKTVSLVE